MADTSDYELIEKIQSGQPSALSALFNRYSPALYEFVYLISGERDQTPRLLEETFVRAYTLAGRLTDRKSARGWLYSLARETALTFLRQKNWLDSLPPSDEPGVSGLPGDIWRAARAMPAFHRAVLILEELHGLSPTEKAQALSVARTDLPRLVEEARRAFNDQFDLQAREHGRPLSGLIDPERLWGMRRRIGNEGSLFGYLPQIILPDSLAAKMRQKVLASTRGAAVVRATAALSPNLGRGTRETFTPPLTSPSTPVRQTSPAIGQNISAARNTGGVFTLPLLLLAAVIALTITAFAACAALLLTRDTSPPVISHLDPPDGATLASGSRVVITARYGDDRMVDLQTVRLVVDGLDVTPQASVTATAVTYTADLDPGLHVLLVQVQDSSGNKAAKAWQFNVGAPLEPTATPTLTPTPSPTVIPSRSPTPTVTGTRLAPPTINAFSANQSIVTRGTSVLLTWSVLNADIVFLNQERVDLVGSRLVTPDRTTTYQLIANNLGGITTATVTIVVQELPDLIVSDISLSPTNQISFGVRNDGIADVTRSFLIQVTANGILVESDRPVSSIPAGQEARLVVPNYTVLGPQVVTVRLNPGREVQESNYINNEKSVTLSGPSPTPTFTPTNTPTNTPTSTPTSTPTGTPTNTPTRTRTPTP